MIASQPASHLSIASTALPSELLWIRLKWGRLTIITAVCSGGPNAAAVILMEHETSKDACAVDVRHVLVG